MSKNVIIDGEVYSGVSDVQLNVDGGGTATFKDVDDIETQTFATPTITVSEDGLVTASANGKSATHQLSAADDADFVAANIALGKTLFGIAGSLSASANSGTDSGSGNSHIFETVIETDVGFTHLNIDHNLGSKKLFWMMRRDMTDYTPKAGDSILACGVTPEVWMPNIELPVPDGTNVNVWDTCSPGNVAGYQRCFWSLTYKDDTTIQIPASSLIIPNFYKPDEQTENKMVVYPNWALTSNIGKFYVTIIDLSAGAALL